MHRTIHTCLFSSQDRTADMIRKVLESVPYIRLTHDTGDVEQVRQCLAADQVDMVMVDLDPDLDSGLSVVELITAETPKVGIIGLSERTDPQTIIRAMRSGCTQFVCVPIEAADLENAVSRIEVSRTTTARSSRRICVMGSVGGVGVTTIACNLARELAQVTGRPCAIVDLNLDFGDVAAAFDAKAEFTVADLCKANTELDRTVVQAAACELPSNVHIFARPHSLGDAHSVCAEGVSSLLDTLGLMYANVVIDLTRAFTTGNAAAVQHADLILIVAQLRVACVQNAHRAYELLIQMGADEDSVHLLLNRYNADHGRITLSDVEQSTGQPVYAKIPNDYRNVISALDLGQPISEGAPRSPARVGIQKLAEQIVSDSGREASAGKAKGFWGRFLSKRQPAGKA